MRKAVDYLKIILIVKNCADDQVVAKLLDNLKKTVESIVDEEKKFCESIDRVKFFEQETFRDKFRLKYKTEKLIENCSIIKFINLKENNTDEILKELNSNLDERLITNSFKTLTNILVEKSANQNVILFEEFLDECFDYKDYDFKSKLQGGNKGRLIEDFLTFKNFLVIFFI